MNSSFLGKVALGLMFPLAGTGYYMQHRVKKGFAESAWYSESIEVMKGYEPAMERLGEPVVFKGIDVADGFNYQDYNMARAKIPLKGQKAAGELWAYARRHENRLRIDYLELKYTTTGQKYKFYDGNLPKSHEIK